MNVLDYRMTREPIVGWRSWRVLPFDRLDGTRTYRLCAIGTLGVPKVWQPLRATEAVCSKYASEHESPWPDCECGIWALRRSEDARRRMVVYMQTQGEPAGWAHGRVSLWGRVIEHEHGWRAQHVYPYAITIESPDERIARVIRDEYAIDVEWAGGELFKKVIERRREEESQKQQRRRITDEEARRQLDDIKKQLKETINALSPGPPSPTREEPAKKRAQEDSEREEEIRSMPPLAPIEDISIDDVLVGFVASVVGRCETYHVYREKLDVHPWSAEDVANCVLYARGEKPPFSWGRDCFRQGLKEARVAVRARMREARDAGLLEYGLPFEARHNHSSGGYWFITRQGLSRVAKVGSTVAPYYRWKGAGEVRHDVDLAKAVRSLRRRPRPLFVDEVNALIPTWMEERRAAQRRGKRAYRDWLQERRANGRAEMLWFTDDEVKVAARRLGRPFRQLDLMAELAPADSRGDRFRGEVAHLSQQLIRLHRDGCFTRRRQGSVIWWETSD
jgi:hypothetical protein